MAKLSLELLAAQKRVEEHHRSNPKKVMNADDVIPDSLPKTWKCFSYAEDGAGFRRIDGLQVIVTGAWEDDGKRWLHVSMSRQDRLPDYADMKVVKDLYAGSEIQAIQLFPATRDHVNLHPNCLHLFACLDGNPLPDFTRGTGSI